MHWQEKINAIIAKLDKNSFYLGNLCDTLMYYYKYDYLTDKDELYLKNLIKACLVKHEKGIPSPSQGHILKVSDSVLPLRDTDKIRQL